MAVALDVQNLGSNTANGQTPTSPATLTITTPVATASAAKIVVRGSWWDSTVGGQSTVTSVSDTATGGAAANWTIVQGYHTNTNDAAFIAYRDAAAGMPSGTVISIVNTNGVEGGILAAASSFIGVAPGAHEAAGAVNSTSGTSVSSGSVTTLTAGALVIGVVGLECTTTSNVTWATGSEIADTYLSAAQQGQSSAWLEAGAPGSYSVSGTVSPTSTATTGRAIAWPADVSSFFLTNEPAIMRPKR